MSFETRRLRPSAIPIRWRLAGGSAILTLLILLTFAIAVGAVLSETLRTEFNRETADAANTLVASSEVVATPGGYKLRGARIDDFAASQQAKIRVLDLSGNLIDDTPGAPDIGLLPPGEAEVDGYVVETRFVAVEPNGRALLEYARPTRGLDQTIARSRLMLAIGVVGGSLLALAAGLLIARRAMRPITELTSAAREIERTADPGQTIPIPEAEDEVRILAETLQGMLESLEIAQQHTLASLDRQRQFVADASHELRTPLTALLANLELLSDNKDPEVEESTEAAIRSASRMGALVSDLLLLARSDS
ncbi:MAG: HAMP domain-containing sensor histidine kinase [Solirubrobacterales bacterium]|nr:HAMP domain-containing sensor histidine kinase [Solirubrobacterales bacterium]